MAQEGRIDVTVQWAQGRCVDVEVASTRKVDVWRALEGRRVDEALVLAPLLSSICSTAHGLAGLSAVEAALGVGVDDVQRALRQVLVASEVLQNHLWFWLLTAPELMGAAPDATTLRQVRAQVAELHGAIGFERPWARVGGTSLAPSPDRIAVSLDALHRVLASVGATRCTSFEELPRLPGPIGATLRFVLNGPLARLGLTPPVTDTPAAQAVAELLAVEPGFAAAPVWRGTPLERGPLPAQATHPLVRGVIARAGHGLAARLVARLVETCAVAADLHEAAQNLRAATGTRTSPHGSGRGVGQAPTSRGPLVHSVHVEQGQVVVWRVVAPTEWTFHPRGAVREALIGLSAPDVHLAADWSRWVVATLDPCVASEVHVRERVDARGSAGPEHR
ncbi:MAG: nickel-dependent hydrogenase large subunit [Myxococcaceae bacterium]|nr:nickel-dependent hydrogenase large subunit [Myxococcaceae bacterium]